MNHSRLVCSPRGCKTKAHTSYFLLIVYRAVSRGGGCILVHTGVTLSVTMVVLIEAIVTQRRGLSFN